MTFDEWWDNPTECGPTPDTYTGWQESCRQAFVAGAASRDADIAELVAAIERMRVAGGSQEFYIAWELAKDTLAKVRKT